MWFKLSLALNKYYILKSRQALVACSCGVLFESDIHKVFISAFYVYCIG